MNNKEKDAFAPLNTTEAVIAQLHESRRASRYELTSFQSNGLSEDGEDLTDALRLYLQEVRQYPLLSTEEEHIYASQIAATQEMQKPEGERQVAVIERGKEATQRMIESNLRLVISIAKRHKPKALTLLDLIQEGNIGLIRAVEKFDHRKGNRFSTYAIWWIRQAILRALVNKGHLIRIPAYLYQLLQQQIRVNNSLVLELGREPTSLEIAEAMGVSQELVHTILILLDLLRPEYPIAENFADKIESPETDSDDADLDLDDLIPDPAVSTEAEAEQHILREEIQSLLILLSERERQVLELRFGLSDGISHTLEEVGKVLQVSRERIRQIENRAFLKLRQHPHILAHRKPLN